MMEGINSGGMNLKVREFNELFFSFNTVLNSAGYFGRRLKVRSRRRLRFQSVRPDKGINQSLRSFRHYWMSRFNSILDCSPR